MRDVLVRQEKRGRKPCRGFATSSSGNMSIVMVAMIGISMFVAGNVLDFMSLSGQRQSLQNLADRAAIAAAQELIVSAGSDGRITAVASAISKADSPDAERTTTAVIIEGGHAVTVVIEERAKTFFSGPMSNVEKIRAEATAEVYGGGYVCMIGLDPDAVATLNMMNSARLSAYKCAVYSNSTNAKSFWLHDKARVNAEVICVAGGVQGPESAFTAAQPTVDCPALDDPLRDRANPNVGNLKDCDFKAVTVQPGKSITLKPGIYCGGLAVMGGEVRLDPGIYTMRNGSLLVDGGGSLEGQNVGFFMSGPGSFIRFGRQSHISLTAPRTGDMVGLLFFEDRDNTASASSYHQITSNDARNLVGTMYLPKSKLLIDATSPVADRSDYTVVIAREFELRDGPELVLNTDYEASTIPVPEGVGNNISTGVRLSH